MSFVRTYINFHVDTILVPCCHIQIAGQGLNTGGTLGLGHLGNLHFLLLLLLLVFLAVILLLLNLHLLLGLLSLLPVLGQQRSVPLSHIFLGTLGGHC